MGSGGILTTDNIPEKTEKLGYPSDNIPETTDFLKHLILSYSLKIKLNTCRNFISIYFRAKCQSKCKIYMQDYIQILNYLLESLTLLYFHFVTRSLTNIFT
jgi:hypothetical protein